MANTITLLRFPLLVVTALMFYLGNTPVHFAAVPVVLVLLIMDTLDGYIARRRQETSLLGSTLDIAADRTVEIVLWICYAHLELISVAIPIIVVMRGNLVDSFRSVMVQRGVKPFEMMRSTWGRWLVATPLMRTSYSVTKITAFLLLALTLALMGTGQVGLTHNIWVAARVFAWLSTAICLLRGIPVVAEGWPLLQGIDREAKRAQ
ncbi:MAG: CDP-alcohol phosphatidyltransferase family protein [Chloroflexi bacterium]|nr:CDP-alcohol phosphatidyltransferase family protein [Chloroflexota bacterium]